MEEVFYQFCREVGIRVEANYHPPLLQQRMRLEA